MPLVFSLQFGNKYQNDITILQLATPVNTAKFRPVRLSWQGGC
jgi:hypothetical protein